ncbi:MAG: TlpA disulfide reductase family protein [Gammaproteobacteria bacterium]|nr:TlpA disulfide reductase family protein [Gammaproteobacteria bacterium]
MRKLFTFMALLGVAALLAACSTGPSSAFNITGELVIVEPEPADEEESVEETEESGDATYDEVAEEEKPVDWSTATVVVTHVLESEDGETEKIELASGTFVDDKITFSGTIDQPTEVRITAKVGEEELSTAALLQPDGEEISFVLVDDMNEYPTDGLYLAGESRRSQDSARKITISGDFSELDRDVNMATFGAYGRQFKDGQMASVSLGSVMLEDGKFLLEADVDDVQVVTVYFSTPNAVDFEDYVYASSRIIAEPNATYEVDLRATDDLFVVSREGKHAELIESWKQSSEYQTKFAYYETSYVAYMAEQKAKREAEEKAVAEEVTATHDEADAVAETEEESEADIEENTSVAQEASDESEAAADESLASTMEAAEGCEHVVIDQTHRSMSEMYFSDEPSEDDPEHIVLGRELTQIQDAAMQSILDKWSDPINVLLAMELGAIDTYDQNREDAFPVYDRLAEELDPEIVAQRVTPARDRLVAVIEREENDNKLLQGQKVPPFTLANAEGEDVVLYDVLAERQITLIDFWASWCGPCIATFPDLKRLYAAYNDHGFEIIGVSIDDNFDDWNNAAIEHDLPWIDVGELKDWEGPVAVSYGVGFIPKAFLVDENGCVLKKNVRPDMLEESLVARFGEVPEPDADETDSDSAGEDPATDEMGG